jgi:hypothetical protein
VFVDVLESYQILHSLFTITCDNASNMSKMAKEIERMASEKPEIQFVAHKHRIHCVAHIINLSVQAFLKEGFSYEAHEDLSEVISDVSRRDSLTKLRRVVIYIRASPQRRHKFGAYCGLSGLPNKELILDVRTRWNSTYDMLERAIELKSAIDAMVQAEDFPRVDDKLSDDDWMFLKQAATLLEPFKILTKQLSGSQYPTINRVMPAYNQLFQVLSKEIGQLSKFDDQQKLYIFRNIQSKADPLNVGLPHLPVSLKRAALAALAKLCDYYRPSALTQVSSCSVALDPRAKFGWWEKTAIWPPDCITTAKNHVEDAWQEFKSSGQSPEVHDIEEFEFVPLFSVATTGYQEDEELESYLRGPILKDHAQFNELVYWKANEATYPCLASMARKYFSVCATSTPSERCFSQAKLFLPPARNRLSPQALKESMLVSSWKRYFEYK